MAAPFLPVRPPILEAPSVCLLTAARVRTEEDERWGNGIAFAPEACPPGRTGAFAPCDTGYVQTASALSGDIQFSPIATYGADQCSTFGFPVRDYIERAEMAMLAAESYWLEAELWSAPVTGNLALAYGGETTVVAGGPYGAADALFQLEQALANDTTGNRAMIHMRPVVCGALVEAKVIRRVGNLWLTYMDNVVVPGRGYPGTGPEGQSIAGGSEWMYASGIVEIIQGPIHHFPDRPEQEILRPTNQVDVFVNRLNVVMFDPCINIAAQVLTPGAASIIAVE